MSLFMNMGNVLKTLYRDRATIYGVTAVKDGPFTKTKPVVICSNYPCKVSKNSLELSQDVQFGTDRIDAILIIDTDIDIPAGASIEITDVNGKITKYKHSSRGYKGYESHQEVHMQLDDKASQGVTNGKNGQV